MVHKFKIDDPTIKHDAEALNWKKRRCLYVNRR